MLIELWDTVLYQPLLNALAFLVSIVPGGDVGLAVVLLTIIVRLILFPLSKRQIKSQVKMSLLAPEVNKIKASGKSKEEQAQETFALYKKHKTNPFAGCLLVLIQIPIIWALYRVFLKGLDFTSANLYSFISVPEQVSTQFLGLVDISEKSIILALIAGVAQFFLVKFMPKPQTPTSAPGSKSSFAENLSKSMQTQTKYVFPVIIAFVAYTISGAIALYLITYNLFALGQQIYLNKKISIEDIKTSEVKQVEA